MLTIKLQRIGKKHQPSYRLVTAVKKSKMAAPPVEDLGSYNPRTKTGAFKKERVLHWLSVGAQSTVTAHNLLVSHGVVSAPKKAVKMSAHSGSASGGKAVGAKTPEAETAAPVATVAETVS
jgi:small subunit ribosomal protein S16